MPVLAGVVPFVLVLLVGLGVYGAQRDGMPGEMATHFGPGGVPDGFMSTGWWPVAMVAIVLVAVVALGLPQLSRAMPRNGRRGLLAVGWATAGLFGYLFPVTTLANAGLADPAAARLEVWQVPVSLAAAAVAGLLGWLIAGPLPPADEPSPAGAMAPDERLDLGSGERAAWSRSTGSAPFMGVLLAGAVVTAAALYYGRPDGPILWPLLTLGVLAGLVVIMLGSVRVTVDHRGLTVASRFVPALRRRVPVDRIESAEQREIRPMQYGGWGYRVLPGSTAVVLRGGEALVLRLRGGREFAVTVGDADTAAALLNTLVDRNRG